jgi:hypothetical protein
LIAFISTLGFSNSLEGVEGKNQPGKQMSWPFPIRGCLSGPPLGNGKLGVMIWGKGQKLSLSFARAGFWDRRNGKSLDSGFSFQNIKSLALQKDDSAIIKKFGVGKRPEFPLLPRQLGGGVLEIELPNGFELKRADLLMGKGICLVYFFKKGLPEQKMEVMVHPDLDLAEINLPVLLSKKFRFVLKPASSFLKREFKALEIDSAAMWKSSRFPSAQGFTQKIPADPGLSALAMESRDRIVLWTGLGKNKSQLENEVLTKKRNTDLALQKFWKNYWMSLPNIKLDDKELQEMLDFNFYKLAVVAHPSGPAVSLQGPLMEHFKLLAWSNDYHFNINVQMIYTAILFSGQFDRMKPLWDMVKAWFPEMRKNGRLFFGHPKAMFLPHATTDQGKFINTSFWTGFVDQGSLAWLAHLAFLHSRFSNDSSFLAETALILLEGAWFGYESQLEVGENGQFVFPFSVSPEWKGAQLNAWGKNSSFQLALCHQLLQDLAFVYQKKGLEWPSKWKEIQNNLPLCSKITSPKTLEYEQYKSEKIAIWDGQDLVESHRHHSHLAGIYPFSIFSTRSPEQRALIENTIFNWSRKGSGAWAGWSVPWASCLLSRIDQPESAISILKWGKTNFTNEGKANLHDVFYPYVSTTFRSPQFGPRLETEGKTWNEIMQLDAGFGSLEAIFQLLVQNRKEGLFIFPKIPWFWKNVRFDGIWTEGGIVVGATLKNGELTEIRLRSTQNIKLDFFPGFPGHFLFKTKKLKSEKIILDMKKDEVLVLEKAE